MDLKVRDVAELLGVSEVTVEQWLREGKIPSYRLDQETRFDRTEIETWMVDSRIVRSDTDQVTEVAGSQQFSLYRALHKGAVLHQVTTTSKEALIRETMQLAAPLLGLDAEVLAELLLDRERLMSTAINHGLAVPHPRDLVMPGPVDRVIVVFPSTPVEWDALDGEPVHSIFFLFSSSDKRHLHLLAKIAHLGASPEALAFLQTRPSKEAFLESIRIWESALRIHA